MRSNENSDHHSAVLIRTPVPCSGVGSPTLDLLALLDYQAPLGAQVCPVPRSDLVYRTIPSAPAPPSLPSEARAPRPMVFL